MNHKTKNKIFQPFSLCIALTLLCTYVNGNKGMAYRDNIFERQIHENATCQYKSPQEGNILCQCPKPDLKLNDFVCHCSSEGKAPKKYICGCLNQVDRHMWNGCACNRFDATYADLRCFYENSLTESDIKIGVLLPYTVGTAKVTSWNSAKYYASAMYLAINDINADKTILPGRTLSLVWADTKCNENEAIRSQLKMIKDENVDAIITAGCGGCSTLAKNAGANNIPMIGYMCNSEDISNKDNYPTFARVKSTPIRFTVGLKRLLDHYNWQNIGVIVADSRAHNSSYRDMRMKLNRRIASTRWVPRASFYSYEAHYSQLVKMMKEMSKKAKIIILVTSVRIAKECLIAAAEAGMVNGQYVFITFETEPDFMDIRQRNGFKWATADYGSTTAVDSYKHFIKRSTLLCKAWQSVLHITTQPLEKSKISENSWKSFDERVRRGMKSFFNSDSYIGMIPSTKYLKNDSKPPEYAENLYDAIRVYAMAIDRTTNNGENYKDGEAVMNTLKNQKFPSIHGYEMLFDENREIQNMLRVYHYGKKPADKLCESIFQDGELSQPFPIMEAIGNTVFDKVKISEKSLKYVPIPDAPLYWPGGKSLKEVVDHF